MHILIDIETVPSPACAGDEALHMLKRVQLERQYKQEATIEKHMSEFVQKMSLEPGTAQVCAIVAWEHGDEKRNRFAAARENEPLLLQEFHAWLNGQPDTLPTFVGFNIRKFDLPVLAAAYMRAGEALPGPVGASLLDGYRRSIDYYSIFGTGLQRFAQALGLHPLAVSGADVAELFEAGDFDAILRHCEDDVRLVSELHQRVHG